MIQSGPLSQSRHRRVTNQWVCFLVLVNSTSFSQSIKQETQIMPTVLPGVVRPRTSLAIQSRCCTHKALRSLVYPRRTITTPYRVPAAVWTLQCLIGIRDETIISSPSSSRPPSDAPLHSTLCHSYASVHLSNHFYTIVLRRRIHLNRLWITVGQWHVTRSKFWSPKRLSDLNPLSATRSLPALSIADGVYCTSCCQHVSCRRTELVCAWPKRIHHTLRSSMPLDWHTPGHRCTCSHHRTRFLCILNIQSCLLAAISGRIHEECKSEITSTCQHLQVWPCIRE